MAVTPSTNQQKYANRNVVHQYVLQRFLDAAHREISRLSPGSILDFGCGEGFFLKAMQDRGLPEDCRVTGIDARDAALAVAREMCPGFTFENRDLFHLTPEEYQYDLVMAIEVLEHLPEPAPFLQHLIRLSRGHILLTVPYEPWFRFMNFLRGRDLARLGNHPEHVNHWSRAGFGSWAASYVAIDRLYSVFPWVVLVGRNKNDKQTAR
jgi:2-polyprenyl-3-methyl-5-hydroxy-6-metoxy-1,4-benzoquinol methylase